jgi:hypothetical protein
VQRDVLQAELLHVLVERLVLGDAEQLHLPLRDVVVERRSVIPLQM